MAIKQQSKNLKYTEAVDMLAPLMFDDDEFDRAEQFKVKSLLKRFLLGVLLTLPSQRSWWWVCIIRIYLLVFHILVD
jgi:hypothetical protein